MSSRECTAIPSAGEVCLPDVNTSYSVGTTYNGNNIILMEYGKMGIEWMLMLVIHAEVGTETRPRTREILERQDRGNISLGDLK